MAKSESKFLFAAISHIKIFNKIHNLFHNQPQTSLFIFVPRSTVVRYLFTVNHPANFEFLFIHDELTISYAMINLNSRFSISNMTDATNHFAAKSLFCEVGCSQSYHCVQMADDLSVQLLAVNFASRTFAYNCLAKGLNKSVTWFSSFVKHYLEPCLAANVCPLCMDDIAAGVNFLRNWFQHCAKQTIRRNVRI